MAAGGAEVKLNQALGNFGSPAGLPTPSLKGVNEPPAGFIVGWPRLESSGDCGTEIFMPRTEGVAASAADGLDSNSCLNRSISVWRAVLAAGACAGEANNFDQLLFSSCRADAGLSGADFSRALASPSELPHPPLMGFNESGRLSEEFQVGNALV